MSHHESTWMIDSGSFRTLTPFENDFSTYILLKSPVKIKALGGFELEAIAIGSVKLKSNVNDNYLTLTDVLHVPKADGRLISVAKLSNDNFKTLFNRSSCTIFDDKQQPLMSIPLDSKSNQYSLTVNVLVDSRQVSSSYNVTTAPCTLQELHLKLGHAHPYVLRRMAKRYNWTITNLNDHLTCDSCIRGKSTKVAHETVASRAAEHFGHIVSGDLIDLHDTPSIGDYKYMSVLVDHFSYYTSVLPLKTKSAEETKFHILAFNAFIRAQTGNNIRIFRSDAGNEYRGVCATSLRELGIYVEIGAPHEPRDNGFVERRNRTLTDMARTILLHSKLPLKFWPYAYDYACYTQNRLGRRGYQYESPIFRIFGETTDFSQLQPFGIDCYMQHTENGTHKMSARSDKAIFLGYCLNTNAFRVFFNNSVRIEQSVHFTLPIPSAPSAADDSPQVNSQTNPPISSIPIYGPNPVITIPASNVPADPDLPITSASPDSPVLPVTDVSPDTSSTTLPIRHSSRPSLHNALNRLRASAGSKRRGNQVLVTSSVTDINAIPDDQFPQEPIGYKPSLKGPLATFWAAERQKEIDNWIKLNVAEISDLPPDHQAIPGHWIHTVKRDAQGNLVRLKARCVADGNHQIYGHNYSETYAATPAPEIARILLTVAASKDWEVHQMDVDCAYLNAELSQPVYMRIPPGINVDHKPGQVFKLLRALYGLKQAGREWAIHLKGVLETIGWKQSPREPCLYSKGPGEFILVYVDDLMIIAPHNHDIITIKRDIATKLEVKDLGEIHDYLGIEVIRNRDKKTFYLRQAGLIDDIVRIMSPDKVRMTPMSTEFDPSTTSQPLNETQHNKYRSVLGKLLYLGRISRPDLSISTNLLGRQVAHPTEDNLKAMIRVAGYLLGSRHLYLALDGSGEIFLTGMSDADWAGDTTDRKSTSGYICYLGKAPIAWSATKQKCVAGSTMHAEYVALSDAAREMAYILNLASSITQIRGPALLYCDNTAAQTIAEGQSGNVTKGAKHIDIRYHIIKELIDSGKIKVQRVPTESNVSDTFTKPLDIEKFTKFRRGLNLQDLKPGVNV